MGAGACRADQEIIRQCGDVGDLQEFEIDALFAVERLDRELCNFFCRNHISFSSFLPSLTTRVPGRWASAVFPSLPELSPAGFASVLSLASDTSRPAAA